MKKLQLATFTALALFAFPTWAQFSISVSDYDDDAITDATLKAQYRTELDNLVTSLNTEVDNALDAFPSDTSAFMDGTADAMVSANAGNSFTYNTDFKLFMAGFNLGATFDKGDASLSKLIRGTEAEKKAEARKVRGAGAGGGLLVGLPLGLVTDAELGFIKLDRVKLFGSLMFLDLPAFGPFDSKVFSIGGGAQYKLIEGISILGGLAGWGGIDVSGGLKYAKVDLSLSKTIGAGTAEVTGQVQGQNVTIGYTGPVELALTSNTFMMPIEISTSAKLLYVFDFFFGLGTDIAFGGTSSDSDAPGDIALTGGPTDPVLAADFTLGDGSGNPKFLNARYFAGLGFDFYVLNFTVQVNQGLGGEPIGVNAGARAYW